MKRKYVSGALGFAPNFDEIKKRRALGEKIFPWEPTVNKPKKKVTDWFEK